MTPSELYASQFQSAEPKFYTRMPNIIDHLTYDFIDKKTGQTIKKRLSVYAKELYRAIRNIAGEDRSCWRSRDNLADLCNMSSGSVTNAKEELQQKFHQLDGNPLIIVNKKEKKTSTGSTIYHVSTIVNIWPWNNAYMATLKYQKEIEALSPHDGVEEALSPHDGAPPEALSPHDTNNITNNNISLYKEQEPPKLSVSVCPLDKECSVPPGGSSTEDQKARAFSWFIQIGCDIRTATSLVESYSLEEIRKASRYVEVQMHIKKKKNQTLGNIVGYLRKTLENKWWEPKKA